MSIIEDDSQQINELRADLKINRELLEQIYDTTHKTNRYIFWGHLLNVAKVLVIIIGLVVFIAYFLPLLKNVFDIYTGMEI